jgi:Ca2+-binding EF-hand superfamily protein
LTIGEAFKIIDADFDGIISIPDLKKFIIEVLKYESEASFQNTKLERLYRIIDQSKSGKIFQSDFE